MHEKIGTFCENWNIFKSEFDTCTTKEGVQPRSVCRIWFPLCAAWGWLRLCLLRVWLRMTKFRLSPAFANEITLVGPQRCALGRTHRRCTQLLQTKVWRSRTQAPLRRARRACIIATIDRDESGDSEAPASDLEPSVSPEFIEALLLEAEREDRAAAASAVGSASGGIKFVQTFPETTADEQDGTSGATVDVSSTDSRVRDADDDDISAFFDDNLVVDDDELESDDTHVVINGSDAMDILGRLRNSYSEANVKSAGPEPKSSSSSVDGNTVETTSDTNTTGDSSTDTDDEATTAASAVFDPDGSFEAALQKAAEELSDERYAQQSADVVPSERIPPRNEREQEDVESEGSVGSMDYFTEENAMYMPSWIREMYEANTHYELQQGADRLVPTGSAKRLQDIVDRRRASEALGSEVQHGDGIADCTVGDVAYDYRVPIEFIVDALLAIGVPVPVTESTSIRDSMTSEEVSRLLRLVATHDPAVLADRYSDNCIEEVADAYDLHTEDILSICKREGLYLCNGAKTHLSVIREDRVLDILLKGEVLGKPYPPLLEGLE